MIKFDLYGQNTDSKNRAKNKKDFVIMKNRTVNILGTEYKIEIHKFDDDKTLKDNSFAGYCCSYVQLIVIADMDDDKHFDFSDDKEQDNYFKCTLRHEITHAFLNESGLKECSSSDKPWARNEEFIDWLAIQFPKISAVFRELGVEE